MVHNELPLIGKLTDIGERLLPYLRVYSNWLRNDETVTMIHGFMSNPAIDEAVAEAGKQFWPAYARAVDLVTQAFPVWDLEEQIKEVPYMLGEDVETFEFLPLTDPATRDTWYNKATGDLKPRYTDSIPRITSDYESLWRVQDFQAIGLHLAVDIDLAPLSISPKNRVYYGDLANIEPLTIPEKVYKPAPAPKPVSYAQVARQPARRLTVGKTPAQEAQAEHMVAALVDDDDLDQPVTPPQLASVPGMKQSGPFMSGYSHTRVNSAGSARSGVSQGAMESQWTPRALSGVGASVASPLLFGAGGGLWSPGFGG